VGVVDADHCEFEARGTFGGRLGGGGQRGVTGAGNRGLEEIAAGGTVSENHLSFSASSSGPAQPTRTSPRPRRYRNFTPTKSRRQRSASSKRGRAPYTSRAARYRTGS